MDKKWLSLFEIAILFFIILGYIWIICPLRNHSLTGFGLLFILALVSASSLSHKKTLRNIGLRFDNLMAAFGSVAAFTLICIFVLVIGGMYFGSLKFNSKLVPDFLFYLVWAFLQQYTFQTFFNLRFSEVFETRWAAVLATSLVFSAVHYPNPFLMPVTLGMGLFWFCSYLKNPNLFVLAFSHALLGTVTLHTLPSFITSDLTVGILYAPYQ